MNEPVSLYRRSSNFQVHRETYRSFTAKGIGPIIEDAFLEMLNSANWSELTTAGIAIANNLVTEGDIVAAYYLRGKPTAEVVSGIDKEKGMIETARGAFIPSHEEIRIAKLPTS